MRKQLGDEATDFFESLSQPAPVSIRLNPFKQKQDARSKTQDNEVSWCDDGLYLDERPAFIYDPLFHAGTYYVQEASSMFAGTVAKRLLQNITDPIVLDAAAAPGGKSTHLLSVLNRRGFLVTNEVIPQRNSILQENIWKWGVSNQAITQQQLHEFGNATEFFDLILLDAPCAGEGLFRRDPDACNEWSLSSVNGCAVRQRQLIADVLPTLKVGGYLIYSTCTYALEENDNNVARALQDFPVEGVDIEVPDGVVKTKHGYQFYPHRVKGEGFYISVLQKIGSIDNASTKPFKPKNALQPAKALAETFGWNNDGYNNYNLGDVTCAVPKHAEPLLNQLSLFNLKSIGTPLYENVNNRAVPHPALALHCDFANHQATSTGSVQAVDLDEQTALQYLYGDSLTNQSDITQGYTVAQYQRQNLGWMKAATNRFNNLYPHPWRIRRRKTS